MADLDPTDDFLRVMSLQRRLVAVLAVVALIPALATLTVVPHVADLYSLLYGHTRLAKTESTGFFLLVFPAFLVAFPLSSIVFESGSLKQARNWPWTIVLGKVIGICVPAIFFVGSLHRTILVARYYGIV